MSYTYGKGAIKKHCYDVFVRTHPTDDQITNFSYAPRGSEFDNYYQLFALAQLKDKMLAEIDIAWTDGDEGHKVLQKDAWYNIDTSGGAITIDFDSVVADQVIGESGDGTGTNAVQYEPVRHGQVGNIIVFELTDATNALTITDSYTTSTVLENVGDIAVFICDDSNTWIDDATVAGFDEWKLWFFLKEGSLGSPECHYYTKIGAIETSPTIKTSEGDTVALGDCTDKILSELIEVEVSDLEVTKDNFDFLRGIDFNETNIDIVFIDADKDYLNVVENPELSGTYTGAANSEIAPNWTFIRGNANENATGSPDGEQCQQLSNPAGNTGLIYQNVPIAKGSKIRLEFWARNIKGTGGQLNLHSYGRDGITESPIDISDTAWRKYYTEFIAADNDMILNFVADTGADDTNEIEFCDVYLYTNAPNAWFVEDAVSKVHLEVTGNDFNKVTLSCKKETAAITSSELHLYNNFVPTASREVVDEEGVSEV